MESSKATVTDEFKTMMDRIMSNLKDRFSDHPLIVNFSIHNVNQFFTYLVSVNNVLLQSEIREMVDFVLNNNVQHPSINI